MLLSVRGVTKDYGKRRAVDDVSFDVEKGEIFGLLGPNGAGKTTLVSMISGLIRPTTGDIFLDGKSVLREPMEVKRRLGVVPQEIALYPTLTALENLRFWAKMQDVPAREEPSRIERVLEITGLSERRKDMVGTFSGGMKRRLNIAVALLHNPLLLILDEPTVGVDPQSRTHILDTVADLAKHGLTVLFTSHYMEEVEHLCRRVAVMDEGKIIAQGTVTELKRIVGEMDEVSVSVARIGGSLSTDAAEDLFSQAKREMPGLVDLRLNDGEIVAYTQSSSRLLPAFLAFLVSRGFKIQSVSVKEPSLEAVFLKLTGKKLRD
ncbi:MAG: ABC transporter ATP-binding protein [Candidatus Fermentithermobacillus carboniphilus]|uniref:ABC transporter ATP-binding protein n=1 Tax=Candidatus Fermentithermobacillus carboniphilus TaxID=3085328 RepID=A0AAT9LEX5_9FIRM|nr:MAG: ABC transporter ATP-binding protein [Candidatus Fermentithermobacillus carboniphilus]